MLENIVAEIYAGALSIEKAMAEADVPTCGALTLFAGRVRNNHQGQDVTGMTYDMHQPLALKTLQDIAAEALREAAGSKIYLAHAHGELAIGDVSVVIAVASPHRGEGYQASRYIIEEIKTRLPVWKREHYTNGKSDWLPGHSLTQSRTQPRAQSEGR